MPRGGADVRENNFLGHSPDSGAVGEKSWLRVARRRELLGRSLEAEPAQIGAKRGIDLTKNPFREGKSLSELFSHSRLLGALPGKEQYHVQRSEANDHRRPGECRAKG